ncbi:retrotransposon protein, putative, ty1-copia subclass [Tanacetum coccineum]
MLRADLILRFFVRSIGVTVNHGMSLQFPYGSRNSPVAIIDRQLPFEYTITSRSTDVVVMALPVQNINHSAFSDPLPAAPAADSKAQVLSQWNAVYDAYNEVACLILGNERICVQLDHLGYMLPQDLIVGLILNGLTKDFAGFVRNYNMHNMGKTIGELHAMLIEYEKGLPKKAETPQSIQLRMTLATTARRWVIGRGYCMSNLVELLKKQQVGLASSSRQDDKEIISTSSERATDLFSWINNVEDVNGIFEAGTPDKLQQRSVKCIFIGYPKETMGYYFYFPPENKIVVARYITSEITSEIPMEVEGFEPPQEEVILVPCLVAKGYTQLYGVDYEEIFSPVTDIRAIRILISIVAFYYYEIWQMDVKTVFLNSYLDEDIYIVHPEGFVDPNHPRKWLSGVLLHSHLWVVDDIYQHGKSHSKSLQSVKDYLGKCFAIKDLGEAAFILGIKIYRDRILFLFLLWKIREAELRVDCYCDAGFETNRDDIKSQTGYVFILNGGAVDWKSSKQSTTAMSATEAEYIAV